jgi:hypothetical protein
MKKFTCLPVLKSSILLVFLLPASTEINGQRKVFISSPLYNIDIGLNFSGQCGPEGGAVFSQYGAVSSFNNMRFVASQTKVHPCCMEYKGKAADFQINGDGSIVSFQVCPDYDPEPQKATVKHGPAPFKPILKVMDKEEVAEFLKSGNGAPALPFETLPFSEFVFFSYTDNFSVANPELQWETEVGKGVIESRTVIFYVALNELGKGKPIELNEYYKGENENGMWNIRIIPMK